MMDNRVVQFIAALRAAGVRISVAESIDAMKALDQAGIADRELFRLALQATLVKDAHDIPTFQELFPMYFTIGNPPPMQQPGGSGSLSEEEQQQLQEMIEEMLANMTPEQLAQLFQSMMNGQPMSSDEMNEMLSQVPMPTGMQSPAQQQERMTRRAMYRLRFDQLDKMLEELLEQLEAQGMSQEARQEIEQAARQNMQALAEQISQQMGQRMLEQMQQEAQHQPSTSQLMDQPFEDLNEQDIDALRGVVNRLAAQLRSRAALRQRRGKTGTLDAKRTIRANMRFGSVPIEVHHRRRHLKPRLTVICDLSYSMRPVASFMLLLIYALQDQISRTRSFAFIHDITDISPFFAELRPEQAIENVMLDVRPPYSYATDLGQSLDTFMRDHCDCVDHRTTVIILGDGRNNHNDPNLRMFEEMKRRSRRVIWFNPEPPYMWGMYDPGSLNSDMLEYAKHCDAVHHVSNLRELVSAIDTLFVR